MTVDTGLFRKKLTYEQVLNLIERDADKIQLPERVGVQLWDSFAFGQWKTMLQEAAAGQNAATDYAQMQQTMTNAATTEGISKQELLQFHQQMQTANSNAHAALQHQMNQNIAATQQATQAHATHIAQ